MLRLFRWWLSIAKFALIVLANTYRHLVSHISSLKSEEKYFFDIQSRATKIIEKTAI